MQNDINVDQFKHEAAKSMSEKELQQNIIDLAQTLGWRTYHPYDSRRSTPGYPDLTLVREGVIIYAELKRQDGKTTAAQDAWLRDLMDVAAVATQGVMRPSGRYEILFQPVIVVLWRPADLIEGRIEAALRGER